MATQDPENKAKRQHRDTPKTPSSEQAVLAGEILNEGDLFHGVGLRLRLPAHMRKGEGAVVEICLENHRDVCLRRSTLTVLDETVALLSAPETSRRVPALSAGRASVAVDPIQLKPKDSGTWYLYFRLLVENDENWPVVLKTYITLKISPSHSEVRPPQLIVTGPSVRIEGDCLSGDNAREIGVDRAHKVDAGMNLNLHLGGTATQVDNDTQEIPLPFFFDWEQTEKALLRHAQTHSGDQGPRVLIKAPKTPPAPEGLKCALAGAALLEGRTGAEPLRFVLLARPKIRMGRAFDKDWVISPYPYADPDRWKLRRQISKSLGELVFEKGGLSLRVDPECHCSLRLNEKPVNPVPRQPSSPLAIDRDSVLSVAGLVSLHIHFVQDVDLQGDPYPGFVEAIRTALHSREPVSPPPSADFGLTAAHSLRAIRLERYEIPCPEKGAAVNPEAARLYETLCLVLKEVGIGSSPTNPICLRSEDVRPIHARILFHDGDFFLQTQAGGHTFVEGRLLADNDLHLLEFGHRIQIGKEELVFRLFDPEEGMPD